MTLKNRLSSPLAWAGTSLLLAVSACNTPPSAPGISIRAVALDGTERAEGEAFTVDQLEASVTSEAVDDNDDPIEYRYAWSKDGTRQADQNAATVGGAYTSKGEVWSVSVTAFDGKESSNAGSAEITIANTPPTATVSISPETPTTTSTVRVSATKSDNDGDATSIRYVWIVNGSPQTLDGDVLRADRTTKGEVWEVQVIPTDGEVDGEPAVATFTIANTAPSVESASLSSDTPDKGDALTCIGEGWEDDDDDAEGYQTEWFINGDSYSTEDELPAAPLNRGDRIRCELTAFDGEDTGNTVVSDEIPLQNTPPRANSVQIGPEDPLKEDVVSATVEGAVDPDGDEITYEYQWFINGSLAGETATLPPSRFRKGDTIRLRLRPFDGEAYGPEIESNTIQAGNNPPVIDEARLTPEDPRTDDIVLAEVFTSDPDGEDVDVTYAWYVNGSKVSETTEELDGATYFSKGDEIYVIATPRDSEDPGPAVTTDTITSINSPPTAPRLVLDPKTPDGTEDAVCKVEEASVDADGDSLTYTFRWTVEGGAPGSLKTTTYTNDTLPGSAYSEEDVLICRVTVSDGTEVSPEATAGTELGSKDRPGVDCQAILDENSAAETGSYWIDPDEDGDISDAIEVVCDMDSDGGGWTMIYYADAKHFDGYWINSRASSSTAPNALNSQKDMWNFPSDLDHSETLMGCTTQNDAATHWWRWSGARPASDWLSSSTRSGYVYTTASRRSSGSNSATCFTNYPGATSDRYGFAAVENGSCGSCNTIVWGAYHYDTSTGCNSTSTTYGNHTSEWRSRTITYPVCNRSQTSNGKFWIAVR